MSCATEAPASARETGAVPTDRGSLLTSTVSTLKSLRRYTDPSVVANAASPRPGRSVDPSAAARWPVWCAVVIGSQATMTFLICVV
jgi:hypothetical protein